MALKAVVFDYGNVLTAGYDAAARARLLELTGLDEAGLERYYWPRRNDYDLGILGGDSFWQSFSDDAALGLSPEIVHELALTDARMWSTWNPRMTDWQKKLKEHGIKTGILSNMGDTVLNVLCATHKWIADFDVVVWSYELKIAKPDAAIYKALLERIGTRPEETLFLDDREENIVAARALGIDGLLFTTVEQLQKDLGAKGLENELPMPL